MRYDNVTEVRLVKHGVFIAYNDLVADLLEHRTKNQMVKDICELWPELIRDGSWTKKELHLYPAYVLAVILRQI